MFREARNVGQRPEWIGENVWSGLEAHWNSSLYRNKCATAKKIEHLKRVEAYRQLVPSPHMNIPFDWYINSIYLSYLSKFKSFIYVN